ncbi:MAG TPA: DUF1800 family protein [Verrucomicrobiota bacterium]|nr:DUF1800 family protein [Verrucomicrobiota bacterium]HNU53319.1 DUF1800 family protein [Verrucomicrobiota bacterium]
MKRHPSRLLRTVLVANCGLCALLEAEQPVIQSAHVDPQGIRVIAGVPAGFRHVVLESRESVSNPAGAPLAAGSLDGAEAIVDFRVPADGAAQFLLVRAGPEEAVPPAPYVGPAHVAVSPLSDLVLDVPQRRDHVLNRLGYGPSPADLARLDSMGIAAHLEQQLRPETIDESDNTRYRDLENALFEDYQPRTDTPLVRVGESWRYFKGTQAPPSDWASRTFDDAAWLEGPTGIGYGDDDDATELEDMEQTATQAGYFSVFIRRTFEVADPASIDALILRIDFDDGFVAYLNGERVASAYVDGSPPAHNRPASGNHEAGTPVEYDLSSHKALLEPGLNVLAIQGHNVTLDSSDFSLIPELLDRSFLPTPPLRRIRGVTELQHLAHVRGIYSRRQLQTVLAEFWDNHFTTDADKVAEYFDDLENSDATDAMASARAEAEAAQVEYEEYQFFHEHALGYFGDLLLESATSPAMLIYLDSVLNRKAAPNENYAREVLELFAFGVDNRYTQTDIEELARCFTGWTLRKVQPGERPPFPASARTPLTQPGVQIREDTFLPLGAGWKYFKGRQEPSPQPDGSPALDWTLPGFDDTSWIDGATGMGYSDGDDATVLTDMRNQYASVYLRRPFTVDDPADLEDLLLAVDYDDGFVAYLNGTEVARSASMADAGVPPRFNRLAPGSHEAEGNPEVFPLRAFVHLLQPAPAVNVLALQVHNVEIDSSDLSILPRLVQRTVLPGSTENGDPNGLWVFRFDPDQHDTGAKVLFAGTPYEHRVPAGRVGADGAQDAIEILDAMVSHPSTREFICLKLINRFVADSLTLESYRNGTAPVRLRQLMDDALAAWTATTPPGHIETVLRAILRPQTQDGYFWSQSAYRAKVKTPVEYINSSVRALDANAADPSLPDANSALGMDLFTRDDPDGWSELGFDWMDTGSLLERIKFVQNLAGNTDASLTWNVSAFTAALADRSAGGIIEHFNQRLFAGGITPAQREILLRFATTDDAGQPVPFDPARGDYTRRVQDLVSLILALPHWHHQ